MNIHFDQKRVLVTGAGKGIGREICHALAESGAWPVALSRSPEDLASLRKEIDCDTVVCDLLDATAVASAVRQAGPVDFLVNNAGISIPQSFLETTADAFDRTMAINVRAAMLVAQVVARDWIARRHAGAIVNLSSQASKAALRDHTAYCASKGAVDALTQVMALELGPHGIRVNALNPTVTLTPMGEMAWGDPAKSGPMLAKIPLGRFARPRDVANAVIFLLSERAAMINGVCLPLDGGFLAT
jgi:NAD(P)-dependent dehydrogenase (short-subunit alcohol dehydrogenase family)